MFDPSEHDQPKGTRNSFKNLEKPGTYMLGITKAQEHGETDKGSSYTKFRYVVIDGPEKGASFFDKVWRTPASRKILAGYCYAVRNTNKFDPMKDADMERQFVGRALMADVEIEVHKGKPWAKLKWALSDYSENELAMMRAWEKAWKENAPQREARAAQREEQRRSAPSDYGSGSASDYREEGGDYGDGGGYESDSQGELGGGAGSWGEDDIPF